MSFLDEGEDGFTDRVMEMDWGEDEEDQPRESPNIFETDRSSMKREKTKASEGAEKPSALNKFADIMAQAPTPKVQVKLLITCFGYL